MAKLRQRYRLYRAETKATEPCRWFSSAEAAQLWLDKKVRTKWWRGSTDVRHVKLVYPYGGGMSGATKEGTVLTICVTPDSLSVPTLIHELAHGIVWMPGRDSEKDHGSRYAGSLIECYRHFDCAETADDLEAAFDEAGVKYEAME
jgi:hypothetical protein